MILDERLRWMGFWMLDKMKGGKTREYYDQIRYAWKEGSSVEETEKRIQNLIAHAVKTTDFYKDYPETCSLEDLPVVNKDTFRQQYDRFVSSTYKDAPDNRVMCTSGSTGTPLRMIQNRDKIRHNTAGGIFLGAAAGYYIVKQKDNKVLTCPIAGTRPRGKDDAEDQKFAEGLMKDPKEKAEHVMLVDLARNDMGRIAEFGTVKVRDFMHIQKYSHVMHIVSLVEGRKKGEYHPLDLVNAFLPAGTLSGAPKVRAMEIIDELESVRRGLYGGAIGYIDFNGDMDFCITIRTMIKKADKVYIQAGAGIVADSNPESEYNECCNKARALAKVLVP